MATAIFGVVGRSKAGYLLSAQGAGLDKITGGGRTSGAEQYALDWEVDTAKITTTNRMETNNALIFQYPYGPVIRNIVLTDSETGTKALTLVLQSGTIPTATIKFIREIKISFVG